MRRPVAWLLAALLFFAALVGLMLRDVGKRGSFAGRYSTWSAEPDGARAAYLVLERLGIPVKRRTRDLAELAGVHCLVLLGPTTPIRKYEADALLAYLDRGGQLLMLPERDSPLLSKLGLQFTRAPGGPEPMACAPWWTPPEEDEEQDGGAPERPPRTAPGPATQPLAPTDPFAQADKVPSERLLPARPHPLLRGVREVTAIVAGTLKPTGAEVTFKPLLLTQRGEAVGALVDREGGGRAIIIAAPDIFSNRRLTTSDNVFLLAALAQELVHRSEATAHTLTVDEYHHGFSVPRTVAGYLWHGNFRWVLLQGCLVAVLLFMRLYRRFGPCWEPEPPSQSARDYLRAMARIYRLGSHRVEAARRVWTHVAPRVAARLGLFTRGTSMRPAEELESLGLGEVGRLYRRAEAMLDELQARPSDSTLLEFGRTVAALEIAAARTRRQQRRREET